jgi:RNA polymerase primary sigma factor
MEHGRNPTDTEIAAGMDLILEQVWEIKENAQAVHLGSLDAPVMGIEGSEDATVGELTGDDTDVEGEVVEQIQDGQLKDALWGCVDSLPDRQPEVIRKRYQQDMTLAEIGKTYGVTAEAVRQTHAKALRELRKPRNTKQLRPFLPGVGIYEGGVDSFNRTWTSSTERAAISMAESMEIEERRREKHMELLDKIRAKVAISQQKGKQHE